MKMELDELKAAWQSTTLRLEATEKMVRGGQTATMANRLRWEPIFELLSAGLALLWSGGFLWDNFAKARQLPIGAIPFGLIYAASIFTIWISVRQLMIVSALDLSDPVVETQRKIAAVRTLRVRSTQGMLLLGLPLWMIFPIALAQSVIGFEVVKSMDRAWLLGNLIFGIAASAGIVWAAKRFGDSSPFFRTVNDILAGTAVAKAQRVLSEVEEFGKP